MRLQRKARWYEGRGLAVVYFVRSFLRVDYWRLWCWRCANRVEGDKGPAVARVGHIYSTRPEDSLPEKYYHLFQQYPRHEMSTLTIVYQTVSMI